MPIALIKAFLSKAMTKQWFWCLVFIVILAPFIIIAFIILAVILVFISITAVLHSDDDTLHKVAIEQVRTDFKIENNLSASLLKAIDLTDDNEFMDNMSDIEKYVAKYFVASKTETIDYIDDAGKMETYTYTYNYFKNIDEIVDVISSYPFNFKDDDILFIKEISGLYISFTGTLPMPTNGVVTSKYGYRTHPITGKQSFHTGIDIAPNHHSPVISVADGVVIDINTSQNNFGNNITIEHNLPTGTIYTFYAHLSKVNVSLGQAVLGGTTIGLEGGEPGVDPNVGLSTGHHLHFEIWTSPSRADSVDPALYLKQE